MIVHPKMPIIGIAAVVGEMMRLGSVGTTV